MRGNSQKYQLGGVKMASILGQVVQSVREIDMIGKSKSQARQRGIKGIHSLKTKNEVLKIGKQFARWVRAEHGVKSLYDVNEQHYVAFLASKSHTTLDYRRSIETHLRLLQEGLTKRAERFDKPPVTFVPQKRLIASRGRTEAVKDRSYSRAEIERIQSAVSPQVAQGIELMSGLGLRVSEVVGLRVEHVQGDKIVIANDTITKGGRDRTIPIRSEMGQQLARLCDGRALSDRLIPMHPNSLQNAFKRGCERVGVVSRGTHGLRHTYARERIQELMTVQERALFANCMERYVEGKRFDYGVHDKELYDSVKAKMDAVHAELGHGKDRFDLAVRYMR